MSATGETSRSDNRVRLVARNSVWLTVDAVASIVVSLILSVAIARSLGPERLGMYNYILWLTNVGAAVLRAGVAVAMQKFAAEMLGRGDLPGALAVLRKGTFWQLSTAIVLLTVGSCAALFAPAEDQLPTLIAVASLVPLTLLAVPSAGLAAAQAYGANVFSSIASMGVAFTLSLLSLRMHWDLVGLTGAMFAARAIDCAVRYAAWGRYLRRMGGRPPRVVLDAAMLRRFQHFATWFTAVLLIDVVVWDRSEMVVLRHFSSLSQVAFYSLTFNIVQQACMLPRMFGWAVGANLMVEQGRDPNRVLSLTADAMRYVCLLGTPLCFGLVALDRPIMLFVYGSQYAAAVPVLTVLGTMAIVRAPLFPVQELLRIREQQRFLVKFGIVMAIVNVALDLLWIRGGGALGAAWANGVAQAAAAAGLVTFANRRLALQVPWRALCRIVIACVPMFVVARAVSWVAPSGIALLIGVPAGVLMYAVGLRLTGAVERRDASRLRTLGQRLPRPLREQYGRGVMLLAHGGSGE